MTPTDLGENTTVSMQPSEMSDPNPLLYKFYSSGTIIALKNSTLAFTPPNTFNDPFEILPRIISNPRADRLRQNAGRLTKGQREIYRRRFNAENDTKLTKAEFNDFLERYKNEIALHAPIALEGFAHKMAGQMIELVSADFAILCMSKRWNHPLMWGHYSGGATGFCVGYRMPLDGELKPLSRVDVSYSEERYPVNELNVFKGDISREIVDGVIRTKSIHWAYEEEVRFIIESSNPSLTSRTDPRQYYLEHPIGAVEEILIGMRCKEEDVKTLRLLQDRKYPHAQLFQTAPDASSFAVVRFPLT